MEDEQPGHTRELFGERTSPADAARRRVMARAWAITLVVHLVLLLAVIGFQRSRTLQVGTPTARDTGIGAFILPGGPPAAAPRPRPVERPRQTVQRIEPTPATGQSTAADATASAEGTSGQSTGTSAGSGGPVRLVQGVDIQLLRRVVPQYPPVMQAAGIRGVVVLDAIIRRDGTIGDVTVLESTNPAFEQAAIAAVRQWQYSPIPYEGILTVTLNFTLTR